MNYDRIMFLGIIIIFMSPRNTKATCICFYQ